MPKRKRRRRRETAESNVFTYSQETLDKSREDLSPAERYAATKFSKLYPEIDTQAHLSSTEEHITTRSDSELLRDFLCDVPFDLDDFQALALNALSNDLDVLVAAPTGSGKTLVGQFAAYTAFKQSNRCFYTTPVKAISNQKFHEFCQLFGDENVGLLTGDTTINSDASVMVMTTEVLRNMIYSHTDALKKVTHVVLDEVHYLGDKFRGPVWEEIVLQLPADILLVSLSATITKPEELGQWLSTVHRPTKVIVSNTRPVAIAHQVFYENKLYPLFDSTNRLTTDIAIINSRLTKHKGYFSRPKPAYNEVILALQNADEIPAIYFVFSRQGCENAVHFCLEHNLRLTTSSQSKVIGDFIDQTLANVPAQDLSIMQISTWKQALTRGYASHHAGLLPVMKEAVEQLFIRGILKVVFATETLALGINMPARAVVIESLTKWNGESLSQLTPAQFTQLAGRAGRRSIDTQGFVVTLANAENLPLSIANLSINTNFSLKSAFSPTYSMAIALLDRFDVQQSCDLLKRSFAQFQADAQIVKLVAQLKNFQALESRINNQINSKCSCDLKEIQRYATLQKQIHKIQRQKNSYLKRQTHLRAIEQRFALARTIKSGDLVEWSQNRRYFQGIIIEIFSSPRGVALKLLTVRGALKVVSLAAVESFDILGHLRVGKDIYGPARQKLVKRLQQAIKSAIGNKKKNPSATVNSLSATAYSDLLGKTSSSSSKPSFDTTAEANLSAVQLSITTSVVHSCLNKNSHLADIRELEQLRSRIRNLEKRIELRTKGIEKKFLLLTQVLQKLGYLQETNSSIQVTSLGERLARLHCQNAILIAECLATAAWQTIDAAEIAAALATLIFTPRSENWRGAPLPNNSRLESAIDAALRAKQHIAQLEHQIGIDDLHEMPCVEIASAVYQWARGEKLQDVVAAANLLPGDVVRLLKQVIDLLHHIASCYPEPITTRCQTAVNLLFKGAVAWNNF